MVWGIIEDITERKQAELTINQKNAELIKSNADKNRFYHILAHDLRSPFNVLLGISDFLIKSTDGFNKEEIAEYLKILNQTAHNTYNLLDDLLIWAKSHSGILSFQPNIFNFSDICRDLLEFNREIANRKNITINCLVKDKVEVFTDKSMIKTIMRNLISNAIKYTNTDGEINISAHQHSDYTLISVLDNGVGIAKEIIPTLFDISNKISTEGTKGESGTGFGLVLCKDFVDKHGGKIWVESEVGKGSEFKFTLPFVKM